MTIKFYNRKKELEVLRKVRMPFLAIIYGRRRIGKTKLALEFVKGNDFIYFFVNPKKSEVLILEEFVGILREKLKLSEVVRPGNWEEFFELLFNYRGYVIFDEFQWFLDINKSVPYTLQKLWDIREDKPSLILTGSVVGMIKKLFIEEGSPLFKRADILIHLKELEIDSVFEILKDLNVSQLEEKFKFYFLFGGIPYYYTFLFKYNLRSINKTIKALILDDLSPLNKEVEEIIAESFKREYKTYLSILFAIAEGKTKLDEISSTAGIRTTSIPYYLDDLINLMGLVEKEYINFKKKSAYTIKDRFHKFWLMFIYKNSGMSNKELIFNKIDKEINKFFGWSFERTIRENILKLFPNFERAIKYYGYKKGEMEREVFDIDVLATNKDTKEILFVECKWQKNVDAKKLAKNMAEKAEYVEWNKGNRKEIYVIFARSFKRKISNFEGKSVMCFDLKDLEKALIKK